MGVCGGWWGGLSQDIECELSASWQFTWNIKPFLPCKQRKKEITSLSSAAVMNVSKRIKFSAEPLKAKVQHSIVKSGLNEQGILKGRKSFESCIFAYFYAGFTFAAMKAEETPNFPCKQRLLSSAVNLCKQFGSRSGPTECRS